MRITALILAFLLFPTAAFATCNELTYKGVDNVETLLAASIASGDYVPVCDGSSGKVKKVDATGLPLGGAFNGTVGATTPAAGSFTTLGATGAVALSSASTFSAPITVSTSLTGNPLVQASYQNITTASANATTPVLASVAGKTIHVVGGGITIMASGTAATATDVTLKCSGGTIIARFPIAVLVNALPVGPYYSTVITRGAALTQPCAASEAVMISSTGALATTTNLFVNIPYFVQ